MSDQPQRSAAEKAQIATQISGLEQQVAQRDTAIRSLEQQVSIAKGRKREPLEAQLSAAREERTALIQEANTLRAELGMPMVIPSSSSQMPGPQGAVAPASAPKKRGWLFKAAMGLLALVVLCGVINALTGNDNTTSTATQPTSAALAVDEPAPTEVVVEPAAGEAVAPTEAVEPTVAPTEAIAPTEAPAPTDVPPTEAPAAASVLEVGQTGELDGLKVTLNEVKVVEGTDFFKPDDGQQFVVVDVTFENTGTQDENISSMLQMEMRDDSGQAYGVDLGAMSAGGGKSPEGAIPPGDKLRGQVGYAVPVDAAGLRWLFKNAFSSGRITFNAQP